MAAADPASRPVALVTGANRGIGRGIAWALADAGFDLALCDLAHDADTETTLAGLAARGARTAFHAGDVAALDGHGALLETARSLSGRIDCLVNNAGVPAVRRGDLLALRPEDFDRVLAVNLRAPFFLAQAVARAMLADGDGVGEARAAGVVRRPRSIVTVSSISATHASPERAEYCLSKSALPTMTRLLALRLAAHGIAVLEVRPGIVPQRRWGEAADVGRTVASLASGALPFATG
ncbi:MAG: SDR family NAD(P)-dependent oxidoreductase [Burkholderiales bacterium]